MNFFYKDVETWRASSWLHGRIRKTI